MRNVCVTPNPADWTRERPVAVALQIGTTSGSLVPLRCPVPYSPGCKSSVLRQLRWDNFAIVKLVPSQQHESRFGSRPVESVPSHQIRSAPPNQSRPGNRPQAQLAVSSRRWVNYLLKQSVPLLKQSVPTNRTATVQPAPRTIQSALGQRLDGAVPGSMPHCNRKNAGGRDRVSTSLKTT
jgi:hypothetical protein